MSEESAVKLKPFSGKEEDWMFWAPMFLARADAKGYRSIAEGDEVPPKDNEAVTDPAKIKLRQLNKAGYSELMALMSRAKVAFLMVRKARTVDLPNGSLLEAWKTLKARYEPKNVETAQEVIDMYNECKLGDNEDPEEWVTRKDESRLRLQLDYNKKDYEEEDFKAAVVHGLPEQYHAEKILLSDKYKTLEIQEIITVLRNRFKELNTSDNGKEEKALVTKERNRLQCFHCGKFGHKKPDCHHKDDGKPDKIKPKNNNNRQRNGGGGRKICSYCNKRGHDASVCFKKKADERNANSNSNGNSDRANVAEDDCSQSSDEHVMMTFEEVDDYDASTYASKSSDREQEYIDFEMEQELLDLFRPTKIRSKKVEKLFTPYDEFGNKTYIKFYDSDDDSDDDPVPYDDHTDEEMKDEEDDNLSTIAHEKPVSFFPSNESFDDDDDEDADKDCDKVFDIGSFTTMMKNPVVPFYSSDQSVDDESTLEDTEKQNENQKDEKDDLAKIFDESIADFLSLIEDQEITSCSPTTATFDELKLCETKKLTSLQDSPEDFVSDEVYTASDGKKKNFQDSTIFIADTGATCHIKTDTIGLTNLRKLNGSVKMGRSTVKIDFQGDYPCYAEQIDGTTHKMILKDVRVAPGAGCNLLSLTKLLNNEYNLQGNSKSLKATKGKFGIIFDRVIEAGSGFLLGIRLVPTSTDDAAYVTLPDKAKIDYNLLHAMLGHPGSASVQRTATSLGLELTGSLEKCPDCATAKMRQKNIPKENENRSLTPGERLYIDTSSVKSKSYGGNKFWSLVVDEATGMTFSDFVARKNMIDRHIVPLLDDLKNKGKIVKYIRCDNAGENKKLKEKCDRLKLGIEFEFTAPKTPQQNGIVERKFATLYGRGRALLNRAKFNRNMRKGLWAEAARIATMLDTITVKPDQTKCLYKLFFNSLPKWARYLRTFGEIGIVKSADEIQSKIDDKGKPCIFVGYPKLNHAGNVYRFFTLDTQSIIHSRDVQWMDMMYRQYAKATAIEDNHSSDDEDDNNNNIYDVLADSETEDNVPEPAPDPPEPRVTRSTRNNPTNTPTTTRMSRELRGLHTYYNPVLDTVARDDGTDPEGQEQANYALEYAFMAMLSGAMDPTKFEDAYNAKNQQDRDGWRQGIAKEFNDMKKRKVWEKIKKADIPDGSNILGSKWVFKKKKNGVYRARLVAKGYD